MGTFYIYPGHGMIDKQTDRFLRWMAVVGQDLESLKKFLSNLPVEVWQAIVRCFVAFGIQDCREPETGKLPKRRMVSRLCLVCRGTSAALRPLLFQELVLLNDEDVAFLRRILRSTVSGWLAPHIRQITLGRRGSFLRVTTLYGLLPSLTNIRCGTKGLYIPDKPHIIPLQTRPYLASIQHIDLTFVSFATFTSFLRTIVAMKILKTVRLSEVEWKIDFEIGQSPDCNCGFGDLEIVQCVGLASNSWPIAWVCAAACVGLRYSRGTARRNIALVPARFLEDIKIVVEVVRELLLQIAKIADEPRPYGRYTDFRIFRDQDESCELFVDQDLNYGLSFKFKPESDGAPYKRLYGFSVMHPVERDPDRPLPKLGLDRIVQLLNGLLPLPPQPRVQRRRRLPWKNDMKMTWVQSYPTD